jgi:hypothetical protein
MSRRTGRKGRLKKYYIFAADRACLSKGLP